MAKKILGFLFLMLWSVSESHGAWNSEALEWGRQINAESPLRFENGAAGTVWGSVQRQVDTSRFRSKTEKSRENRVRFYPPGFGSDPLREDSGLTAYFSPHTDSRGRIKRAPLVVVLSGIFGLTEDPVASSVISVLKARGTHVLSLSNAWTPRYQSFLPQALPGDLQDEARVVLEVLQQARARIPEGFSESVSIVGVSYGAFLASVVAAIDNSDHSQINGSITLLSPPVDFSRSMGRFDRGFARMWQDLECQLQSFVPLAFDFWRARRQEDLQSKHVACADYQVFRIFHEELVKLAHSLHETRGLGLIPPKNSDPVGYQKWKERLNFSGFVEEYLGEQSLRETPWQAPDFELGKLSLWLAQLPLEIRRERLRILAASDDFINGGAQDWQELEGIPKESLILLNWGGHYGYSAIQGFDDLL